MEQSTQRRFRLLMVKYLENRCSSVELEELLSIIRGFPESQILGEFIDNEAFKKRQDKLFLPEDISKSIFLSIEEQLIQKAALAENKKSIPIRIPYLRIAAALLVGMACSVVLYFMFLQSPDKIVKTAFGEIKEVTLPDNSIVVLNGNSMIRYDPELGHNPEREVFISGEAFFKIVHKENNQKFKVHTSNNVTIEVLGTEFNVNERKSLTKVVLHSGKILLGIQKKEGQEDILMSSGEYVEVKENEIQNVKKHVDSQLYLSWKNKKLIFKETTLREILSILENNYGINAVVRDSSILNERFTATYPSDDVDILVKALEKSFSIKRDSRGNNIIIGE